MTEMSPLAILINDVYDVLAQIMMPIIKIAVSLLG